MELNNRPSINSLLFKTVQIYLHNHRYATLELLSIFQQNAMENLDSQLSPSFFLIS
jgi:hypothetical protein